MIRLLKWLITGDGHLHKWKIIKVQNYTVTSDFGGRNVGIQYDQQCEHCGKMKTFRN